MPDNHFGFFTELVNIFTSDKTLWSFKKQLFLYLPRLLYSCFRLLYFIALVYLWIFVLQFLLKLLPGFQTQVRHVVLFTSSPMDVYVSFDI